MSRRPRLPWCLRHHLALVISSAISHLPRTETRDPFLAVRDCPKCLVRRPGKSHG